MSSAFAASAAFAASSRRSEASWAAPHASPAVRGCVRARPSGVAFEAAVQRRTTWLAGGAPPLSVRPADARRPHLPACTCSAAGPAAGSALTPERVAHCMDVLRRDLPEMFDRDVDYSIYDREIEFRDPVNKFSGMEGYKTVWWTLRYHAKYFTELHFTLRELESPAPDTILAAWTLQGVLRLPWRPRFFFNGESTYRLNGAGMIYDHEDWWDRPPLELLLQFFRTDDPSAKDYPLRQPRD